MKTLVFCGSARKGGHTRQMVDLFAEALGGEVEVIDAYRLEGVTPCRDCRYCWKRPACCVKDAMQEIYAKVEAADNLVFASPVYFHSVTGELKRLIDRFQVYWAGHVRGDLPEKPTRRGAILLVGGAPSFPNQFLGAELVLTNLLSDLSAECLGEVCLENSDHDSLETRPEVAEAVVALAKKMRSTCGE